MCTDTTTLPASGSHHRGISLVEVLVCLALLIVAVLITFPALAGMARSAALSSSARQLSARMAACRAQAIFRNRAIGLEFERNGDGEWLCQMVEDGDGDGIRSDDLKAGRDARIGAPLRLDVGSTGPGFLAGERIPDPSGRGLLRGDMDDPIRAGRGDIITFTPQGTATPSSVYFTDFDSKMRVLRIYGGTGKVHQMLWQPDWPKWKRAEY